MDLKITDLTRVHRQRLHQSLVVVIEDDPTLARIYRMLLEKAKRLMAIGNFEVVDSAERYLRNMGQWLHGSTSPIVISDLNLGDGMDGIELAGALGGQTAGRLLGLRFIVATNGDLVDARKRWEDTFPATRGRGSDYVISKLENNVVGENLLHTLASALPLPEAVATAGG